MRFLIALVCCIVLIGILAKPLKRHPAPFYIVALALVGLYWFGTTTNTAGGLWPYFMPLMQRCALAFVLFTIVMFVGRARRELAVAGAAHAHPPPASILGCIFALGHLAFYGVSYVPRLGSAVQREPRVLAGVGGIAGSSDGHPAGHLVPGGEAPHERRALERRAAASLPVLPAHVRAPAADAGPVCAAWRRCGDDKRCGILDRVRGIRRFCGSSARRRIAVSAKPSDARGEARGSGCRPFREGESTAS